MSATVIWRPEAMNARLIAATGAAARDFARLAAMRSPSRRVAASIGAHGAAGSYVVGSPDPLARILESGAGPHMIEPKRKVLRLADGSFVTGPVRHPGSPAQPFLKPLKPLWPCLYRRQAAQVFRGI